MLVLEKLWRGEITPCEKEVDHNGKYHKLMKELCCIEERLIEEMSPERQKLWDEYANIQFQIHSMESYENFVEGFQLGAGLMLDAVAEHHSEFHPIGEECTKT